MKKLLLLFSLVIGLSAPAYAGSIGDAGGFNGGASGGGGGGGGGAPSGPAGGDLGGSYPNPTVTGLTHAGGSTLDNVVVGGATPVAGTFTTLKGTGATLLGGAGGSGLSGYVTFPGADTSHQFSIGANSSFSGNFEFFEGTSGSPSATEIFRCTNDNCSTFVLGTRLSVSGNLSVLSGGLINSTGGTSPTATCSGGSTGVVVSGGNSSCTASVTPFPCCTGNTTGTCSNSTDNRGTIQTSSSASTNCTITFNHTWPQTPMCVFDDGSASTTPTAFAAGAGTTTTYVFDFASTTSKIVNYVCL